MKRILYSAAVVLCLLVPTWGRADEAPGWRLRFGGAWTDIDVSFLETDRDDGSTLSVDGEPSYGLAVSVERRLSEVVGLEVGIDWAQPDVVLWVDVPAYGLITLSDSLDLVTYRASLNLYLLRSDSVDLYVGPTVAWINPRGTLFFSTTVDGQTASLEAATGNDWGWGGLAGVDVVIGDAWTVNCSASYLEADMSITDLEDGEGTSLDLDPVTLRLGFGVRF